MVVILQWNARSLLSNGQEFKHFINELSEKPDIMCIQETWLRPNLECVIHGYTIIRRDRNSGEVGGGCAILMKVGIPYRLIRLGEDQEYMLVEIWVGRVAISLVNYYNPCKKLDLDKLLGILGQDGQKVIWCADFNAYSSVWGGRHTDANGRVIEELMEEKELVCLNNGRGMRINVVTGDESVLDITLVSNMLAGERWGAITVLECRNRV